MFTFNHHVICHIVYLIKQLGNVRATSARVLERCIGTTKRATRSTKCAGINAGNHLEQDQIFSFLELCKIIDFDKPFKSAADISKTFRYHPKYIQGCPNTEQFKSLPQQWEPFPKSIGFNELTSKRNYKMEKYGVTFAEIKKALLDYLGRLTGTMQPKFTDFHKNQVLDLRERLWSDSLVYSCSAYKESSTQNFKRDGFCYIRVKQTNK
jgi:hypothetical protein